MLDSLPPRLLIRAERINQEVNQTFSFEKELNFSYYNTQLRYVLASYVPESAILYVNRNHYVFRHRFQTAAGTMRTLEWDHLGASRAREVSSTDFYKGREDVNIYAIVFRIKNPSVRP